jgi:hypothetical protein
MKKRRKKSLNFFFNYFQNWFQKGKEKIVLDNFSFYYFSIKNHSTFFLFVFVCGMIDFFLFKKICFFS